VSLFDRLLGRGGASVTVPVMDGPFLPNRKLETAEETAQLPDVDNLTTYGEDLYASSGADLVVLRAGLAESVASFKSPISAMASYGEALAVGLEGQGLQVRGGMHNGLAIPSSDASLRCITAIVWLNNDELVVCNGSAVAPAQGWRRSLMQLDASGSVHGINLKAGSVTRLQSGLAWPAGVAKAGERLFITESWRHRVLEMGLAGGKVKPVLTGLPAYPARLVASAHGGYWLSFYSVRNQLVEFILHERAYRQRMIAEIPEPFWMAPSLSSGHNFQEPMQGSQLRQMGILKPYSAGRSYGLVAYCDAHMTPLGSFHSRADGRRHGAVATAELKGALFVASKGSHAVLRIADPLAALME
jgi:hypothetical protein